MSLTTWAIKGLVKKLEKTKTRALEIEYLINKLVKKLTPEEYVNLGSELGYLSQKDLDNYFKKKKKK